MRKPILYTASFILVILFLMLAVRTQAQTEDPTAVTLVSFTASPLDNAVRLVWITGTEPNTTGFRIKRGAPEGPFDYLDFLGDDASGIIYGLGGVSDGAIYERTDNTVLNGEVYTYILVEIENNGSEVEPDNARRTVTVGLPPTNTPVSVVIPGAGATSTPPANPTLAPISTATGGAATAQPNATATLPRFATVTPAASQPTATPPATAVGNSGAPPLRPTNPPPTPTPTANAANDIPFNTETAENPFSPAAAQAQTLETATPDAAPGESGYPGLDAAGSDEPTPYPGDQAQPAAGGSPTRVAVIGSAPGYAGDASLTNPEAQPAAGDSRGTLFLWVGFIVALLIFITGIIGSIILYTRKSG